MADQYVDPRTWPVEDRPLTRTDVALIVSEVLANQPHVRQPSQWTPTAVGTLLTVILTGLGGTMGLREVLGSGDKTRDEIRTSIAAHASEERRARDEITERLTRTEREQRWAAAGLCIVNGRPLHASQPCDLTLATQSPGPGALVREAYGRVP